MKKIQPLSYYKLQFIVFALVSSAFTNIYITQPVLPVLQQEFSVDMVFVSLTVTAVILGITLSNLPFGLLADRLPIHGIILSGGILVALGGLVSAATTHLWILLSARFLQGLFIPSLTTCLAAYLSKTLPAERLNIVMGSYVSATVLGGLCGRLLGGWIHPPLHWRYAFVSASLLTLFATFSAVWGLPKNTYSIPKKRRPFGYSTLLMRWDLLRIYLCATGGLAAFSSVFNYLPYRLAKAPFTMSTEVITLFYLVYIIGIFMGPFSGRISNRYGSGNTLIAGSIILVGTLGLLLLPWIVAIILGLTAACAGFFTIHAAAVGALNRKLTSGQGRANALYVLFYYVGGWIGITSTGMAYEKGGWHWLVCLSMVFLILPLAAGIFERRDFPLKENMEK